MVAFNQLVREHRHAVDFITVYIREMHPADEWSFSVDRFNQKQPKTLDERIFMARLLENEGVECPILVDTMTDEAANKYEGMPERLYVFLNKKFIYKGGQGPEDYNLDDVIHVLNAMKCGKME